MVEPSDEARRSAPKRDWRWSVALVGRVLIATGLLLFAFVAYQLWGTGLQYAQAQDRLDDEFAARLAAAAATATTATTASTAPPPSTAPATTASPPASAPTTVVATTAPPPTLPPIAEGDAVARIEAPAIGLDATVVAGVSTADLRRGPGHYPGTPLPGQFGNAAIAGHRTTYGQPFYRVDELVPGDEIVVTTVAGRYVYSVTGSQIVTPADSHVIATTDPTVATLTLTSCHPRYTADQRIIVSATLDADVSDPVGPATPYDGSRPPGGEIPGDDPAPTSAPTTPSTARSSTSAAGTAVVATVASSTTPTTAATATSAGTSAGATTVDPAAIVAGDGGGEAGTGDAFAQGWFDDDGAAAQVALWGLALTAVSIGAYRLSRATRRNWVGALVGIGPFVVCLYFFFENVNRLLPAAL